MHQFEESVYQLIVETSTNLPGDVRRAVNRGRAMENQDTRAGLALSTITRNINMAEEQISPICQDTGMPTFIVHTPVGVNQIELKKTLNRPFNEQPRTANCGRIQSIRLPARIAATIWVQAHR